jgi:FkbM family methyltransferase
MAAGPPRGVGPGAAALGPEPMAPGGEAGTYRLKRCRYGPMLYDRFDRFVGRSLDLLGEYCEQEAALLRSILRPGDVVVEAGANIGTHTVPMAQAVGGDGRIVAFEPQRLVFQLLCANLALNELHNVDARQQGLGAVRGSAKLPVVLPGQEYNFGGVSLSGHESGETVTVETIDAIGLKTCRLIKADVEGMEREVLLGAEATIARCRPVLYVENDRPQHSRALLTLIMGWGYCAWWDFPALYNSQNFAGSMENPFGAIRSRNLLCVPREAPMMAQSEPIASPEDWPG